MAEFSVCGEFSETSTPSKKKKLSPPKNFLQKKIPSPKQISPTPQKNFRKQSSEIIFRKKNFRKEKSSEKKTSRKTNFLKNKLPEKQLPTVFFKKTKNFVKPKLSSKNKSFFFQKNLTQNSLKFKKHFHLRSLPKNVGHCAPSFLSLGSCKNICTLKKKKTHKKHIPKNIPSKT